MGGKWWLMMCVWTDLSKLSSPLDLFKTRWYWMCDQHAWLCNHVARQTSWCSCWIEGAQSDVPPEGCNWWFDGLIIHERFYCKFVWIYCFNWYCLRACFPLIGPQATWQWRLRTVRMIWRWDWTLFKPFIEVVQIFIDIPLSIAAWGLPKPCNGGKINRHLKGTRFLNLH